MSERGVAVVTGAGKRVGRTIALDLAAFGYDIGIHYNGSADAAAEVKAAVEAQGRRAVTVQADLSREEDVERIVPTVAAALGPVTCLINNAAIFERDEALTATRESWDRHMETNLRAPFVLMQAMARALPAEREGAIVNLIDQRVWNLTPHFTSYTVAKLGLWTLTQTLALAFAPRIRVNAIGPGPTLPSPFQTQEQFDLQARSMPLGHGTSPEEIAHTVRFLLETRAMTGQMVALDGGQHMAWNFPVGAAASDD